MSETQHGLMCRYRVALGLFMIGLVLSGLTAFPLLHELEALSTMLGLDTSTTPSGLGYWVLLVRDGLHETYTKYPWVGYGTDWLAFAHVAIAVFFIGPWREPVRNVWVIKSGLVACAGILPLAPVCGTVRGIPWGWQMFDFMFGALGAIPLVYCLRLTRIMERGDLKTRSA